MIGIHGTTQENKNYLIRVNYEVLLHLYSSNICVNIMINIINSTHLWLETGGFLNEAAVLKSSCIVFFSVGT